MRKRSRVLDDDDDDDDDNNNKQVGTRNANDSSSSDEEPDSSSSSSSSSDDERTPRKKQAAKDRGRGSMSQMKESADREKARIEKGRSSSQPPKKRGRPSKKGGIDDDDDEYTEKGGSGKDMVTRDEHDRLVSMTIQLFLYSNTHKRPIKREDIGEYVLKDYKGRKSLRKLSKSVFDEAVAKIKDIFGYDVKVLKKPIVKGDIATAPSTAVFYVLVNSLTKHQEEEEEGKEEEEESEKEKDSESESEEEEENEDDDDKKVSKKNKRIEETLVPITLRNDIDAAHHGLLMVILGIIVLSNGIIQEETLFEKLRMAKVGRGSPDNDVDDPVFKSVRDVVSSFVSQQYLTRIKTKGAKKTDDAVKNIVIGPRTIAEFDLKRIAVFVMRMFGIKEPSEKYLRAILSTQSSRDLN